MQQLNKFNEYDEKRVHSIVTSLRCEGKKIFTANSTLDEAVHCIRYILSGSGCTCRMKTACTNVRNYNFQQAQNVQTILLKRN